MCTKESSKNSEKRIFSIFNVKIQYSQYYIALINANYSQDTNLFSVPCPTRPQNRHVPRPWATAMKNQEGKWCRYGASTKTRKKASARRITWKSPAFAPDFPRVSLRSSPTRTPWATLFSTWTPGTTSPSSSSGSRSNVCVTRIEALTKTWRARKASPRWRATTSWTRVVATNQRVDSLRKMVAYFRHVFRVTPTGIFVCAERMQLNLLKMWFYGHWNLFESQL